MKLYTTTLLFLLLFIAFQAGAQKVFMKVTGSKTGVIKDQTVSKYPDKIELTGYSFDASTPVDMATVARSPKRTHSPLIINKVNNQSSVLLFAAQAKGEILTKVVIEVYKINNMGMEILDQTIELSNATITFFRQNFDNNPAPGANKGPNDEIRLAYQKITYTYANGGAVAEDSW